MADTTKPAQGAHIDIPAVSSISGRVAMRRDTGRSLWSVGGSAILFLMALAVFLLPIGLLFGLLFHDSHGLAWIWIGMMIVTGLIAALVAFGIVRSVLEGGE
jgi:hypothetical protein